MYPGEYTNPLTRKTNVQVPVVSGYVTARLQAQDYPPAVISGTFTQAFVTFENTGANSFAVLLRETDDRSISGTRYNLMSAVSLVPGGQTTTTVNGYRPFLELYCTGTTTGFCRMSIDSQRRWTEMGFDKTDAFYPPSLWQAKEYPGPL